MNTSTQARHTTRTDATGAYLFPTIDIGQYDLTVSATGHETHEQTGIVLEAGSNISVNVRVCSAIKIEVARRGAERECLAQLLNNPGATSMHVWIAVNDLRPISRNDQETERCTKGQRQHGKRLRRCNGFLVSVQECGSSLCWLRTPRHLSHPVQHCTPLMLKARHLRKSAATWPDLDS
jgi:Carboxypeptidase regulatory-like domain